MSNDHNYVLGQSERAARRLELQDRHFAAPSEALLDRLAGTPLKETIRDYILNTQFRRDVFIKGASSLSLIQAEAAWLERRFVLSTPIDMQLSEGTARATFTLRSGEAVHFSLQYGSVLDPLPSTWTQRP